MSESVFCRKLAQMKPKMTKRDAAEKIKIAAESILTKHGTWESVGDGRVLGCNIDQLKLMMATPFSFRVEVKDSIRYAFALSGKAWKLDETYKIDIWHAVDGRFSKVFSLSWAPEREPTIVNFRRGTWESDLLTLAEADRLSA